MNAIEPKTRSYRGLRGWPPQVVLLVTFACFYFAIGPGNFFAVDEVMQEETAQALILRHTIDIPLMVDARFGRARNWYTVKGPGLPMVSLPFVYFGLKLDDALGSMNGGRLAGPPVGPTRAAAAVERTVGDLGVTDCQCACGRRDRRRPVYGWRATITQSTRGPVDGDSGRARDAGHVGGDAFLSARA